MNRVSSVSGRAGFGLEVSDSIPTTIRNVLCITSTLSRSPPILYVVYTAGYTYGSGRSVKVATLLHLLKSLKMYG